MATTNFTTSLKLALPTTGDLTGTWGQTVNDSITTLLDTAVAGNITKDMAALGTDWTLTSNNGATDEARYAILIPYGNTGATRSIFAPKVSKVYIVINSTNASVIIRGGPTSPTTGVTVAAGTKTIVAWNSNLATPDFVEILPTTVTTATNLAGGSAGTIPYQSASGTTAMLAAGTATYVLTANGAAPPTWQPPTSVSGYLPLTGGTMTGNLTLDAYTEKVATLATSGTIALNPSTGTTLSCAAAGTVTFTDSLSSGQSISLLLTNGSSFTINWPTTTWVTAAGNTAPTLSASNTLVFWKISTTLYGALVGKSA